MLNPSLYRALKRLYPSVEVKHENQPADIIRETRRVKGSDGKVRTYINIRPKEYGRYGEKYVMDCPFCSDRRKRFSVSYLFGTRDSQTGQTITYGLHCFNEQNCHKNPENRKWLLNRIQLFGNMMNMSTLQSLSEHADDSEEPSDIQPQEAALPGECIPLADLPSGHPALEYLILRGISPQKAAEQAGVMYVRKGYYWRSMDHRILIPFYRNGMMIGWTARQIEDDGSGRKYLNSSGFLTNFLYGLRGATSGDVAVIVEGPIDRWSVGKPAVSLLTKSLGYGKALKLKNALLASSTKLIVVLVDPYQSESDKAAGNPHQMDVLCETIKQMELPIPHLPVWLPKHLDPGACHGRFLAHYLKNYLRESGYGEFAESLARDVLSTSFTI